jgi:sugar phosphate isomerase/epimerase
MFSHGAGEAQMKPHPELTVAYWTIAGAFPGAEREYSPFDFKDRVEAAARAGFSGMGIWHADLDHILKRRTLKEMKQILDDNGMRHTEVEFLTDWFLAGERKKQSDVRKKKLLKAAEALQAKQVKVGDFYRRKCSMPRLIDSFAALCAEAAEHGTRIAFEPMAVSMVHTLKDVLTLVEGAAAKNGGIILDLWHVLNLGISYEEVSRIPVQYVFGAEVNDGTFKARRSKAPAGAHREPVVNRRFCGEGEFDIRGFIESVQRTGYTGPWGVEVFSEDLLTTPMEELVTRAFNTTMPQFLSRLVR